MMWSKMQSKLLKQLIGKGYNFFVGKLCKNTTGPGNGWLPYIQSFAE